MYWTGLCARSAFIWLLTAAAVAMTGCGQKPAIGTVKGVVKLRDTPLTFGTISMESIQSGIGVSASIGPDGSYEMRTYEATGLPPGTYSVAVTSQAIAKGDAIVLVTDKATKRPEGPEIPKKYQSSATSGITVDVKAGENSPFDINLE